jgi:GST-like protein
MPAPIEVLTWPTPNGHKVHVALEELGLPYTVTPIDIGAGEQFGERFLSITPNHRIPAIVDPEGPGGRPISLFESGAILIYLAEKTGQLLPRDGAARYECLQWVMFQMGGVGPMFGQFGHFNMYAKEKIPYAIERYGNEVARLHRVLDKRLSQAEWLAGGDYSIADIITFPWLRHPERRGIDLAEYPNVKRWFDAIDARPAVQRGCAVLAEKVRQGPISDAQRDVMFGAKQFAKR